VSGRLGRGEGSGSAGWARPGARKARGNARRKKVLMGGARMAVREREGPVRLVAGLVRPT
jgi:hypothetical protein